MVSVDVNLTGGLMTGGAYMWDSSTLNSKANATGATFASGLQIRKDWGSTDLTIDVEDGAAASDLDITGVIGQGGVAAVTKTGAGTLTLSGANAYTGGTTVNAGNVNVANDQSAAPGGWAIGANNPATCTVNFEAGSSVAVGSGGSIQVGAIPGGSYVTTAAQGLNVAGSVANDGTLAIGRNGTVNINSGASWTQNGDLTMDGIGGYSCWLNVNAGGSFTYAGSNSIKVNPTDGNSGSSILTIGDTFVTVQGFQRTATGTGSGQVRLNGGTLRLSGDVADLTVNAGAMPFTFALDGGGGSIDTDGHSAAVSGSISGSGALTKTGGGTLRLTAINTYTGGTTVNDGTLELNNNASWNDSLVRGTLTVNSGGTLLLTGRNWVGFGAEGYDGRVTHLNVVGGTVSNTHANCGITGVEVNLTGGLMTGGTYMWVSSALNSKADDTTATFASGLQIRRDWGSTNLTIDVEDGAAATDLDITGAIREDTTAAAVTKTGAGVLRLSGANTYTGETTIEGGTLALGAANSLGTTNNVTLSGGTLDAGTVQNSLGVLTVAGGGSSTIRLGTGAELSFKASDGVTWDGQVIIDGRMGPTSLRFGTDAGGLTDNQLALMRTSGGDEVALDAAGYVVSRSPGTVLIVR